MTLTAVEIVNVIPKTQSGGSLVVNYKRRRFILNDSKHTCSAIGQDIET